MKYYRLTRILKENALYNIIYSERSNGKTYAALEYGIEQYFKHGYELAVIRRMEDDFLKNRGSQLFANLVSNGVVEKLSDGKYTEIIYKNRRWYFSYWDDEKEKRIMCDKPFAYAFAISTMEHDKSTSYPDVKTIVFDEFMSRTGYLNDEFTLFMNTLSTIIREKDDVKIFMLGNTVNKYCPYFEEMGLTNAGKMKQGTIDVYTYGDTDLTVAVEYAEKTSKGKKSDKYFAFNNPKLKMITSGEWEIDIYPHLPVKYKPKEVLYNYFIEFGNDILHCEIISTDDGAFTFIHRKTTPIKNDKSDLVYTTRFTNHYPLQRRNLLKSKDKLGRKIYTFFERDKVFYQTNEIGEIMRNYLMWCSKN